jgi:hypothetical protein
MQRRERRRAKLREAALRSAASARIVIGRETGLDNMRYVVYIK